MQVMNDTIFAPSTAIGGAIAVIRISGPESDTVARTLLQKRLSPRRMTYALLQDGSETLDACMAVWFPAPHSYTGEDMLELHCHGGIQTFRRVSEALLALHLRPAEGGEFTKRAFLNGKMDLTQAEAVMDVINAQADASLKSALHQLGGGVGRQIASIEDQLLNIRSAIEAAIDYPDEMEEEVTDRLPLQLNAILQKIEILLEHAQHGRFLREGIRVVILGKPNVGKSSLFNALLGEDRAIVTGIAGTTRDVLDERVTWDGVSVRLLDTAGLREAADEAESIGIDRARQALKYADLLLIVLDGSNPLSEEDQKLLFETAELNRLIVLNKCDRPIAKETVTYCKQQNINGMKISCKSGEGIQALRERIISIAEPERMDTTCITNLRHIRALERARSSILQAKVQTDLDCIGTELHEASHQLGTITGTDVDEKLLDRIFENFCVGK